ncbi:MAG: tRNA preQ1(34) S-adenosylmethionine ribosyltransferase-isomerase QueA [Planctomycetota bacterium]|nr:tRNA preQ1(34) S-adenosylmethionine ribosyltransferase-isomerase QueA [Planctomycetota bacterium]
MTADDFDFPLDEGLIAQEPLADRSGSRLMRLDRATRRVSHHRFADLPGLLRPGDLLVVNDTRVVPARFFCRRPTGGRIEGLFLRQDDQGYWQVLLKNAGRCKPGEVLTLQGPQPLALRLVENVGSGEWLLAPSPAGPALPVLEAAGVTPLPPYIHRPSEGNSGDSLDRNRYQTVYAARPGAVAAPTAGLHFTGELLAQLADRDIHAVQLTLHVGLGTFLPVTASRPEEHRMHSEWYELSPSAAAALNSAKASGRRLVAVGTTSVRVLETLARRPGRSPSDPLFAPASGWTDIFLYPPASFFAVDALITNFHLPRSTLLMLVSAFCCPASTAGIATIQSAYREAVERKYRFFSYGDAMLIE